MMYSDLYFVCYVYLYVTTNEVECIIWSFVQPECSLHLHMDSSAAFGFTNILSKESAVGLIMAQGNIYYIVHVLLVYNEMGNFSFWMLLNRQCW